MAGSDLHIAFSLSGVVLSYGQLHSCKLPQFKHPLAGLKNQIRLVGGIISPLISLADLIRRFLSLFGHVIGQISNQSSLVDSSGEQGEIHTLQFIVISCHHAEVPVSHVP
ncbi:hypothetical protein TNCT_655351 [Trichonephila clavata]|uniref:Uncharacterized protein n=1 Tax=Trichonephila clavata TaxID=2740835 RepID=A0A8X6FTT6_TRICU|nr:hypothetical protein TNCT_655351 [Trichonephila clavata]